MNTRRRLSQSMTSSAHKALKLDSVNKILKIDRHKRGKRDTINKNVSRIALAELIKNTSIASSQNEQLDFKTFMSHKENIDVFKEFLQSQYCQENLDFYLACEKYHSLDPDKVGQEMLKFMANQIYNDYLGDNARQPVNVNHACIQEIKKNLKHPKPDLFCGAQAEIYELMRTDCYPRFYRTWEMDHTLAEKILRKHTAIARSSNNLSLASSSHITNSLVVSNESRATHSFSSLGLPSSTQSTSTPTLRSRRISIGSSRGECPPECPYFRIGRLPCQSHRPQMPSISEIQSQRRKSHASTISVRQAINLRQIHKPPPVCLEDNGLPKTLIASPPAPPLPPKPDRATMARLAPAERYRPYVGKVFDV